MLISKSWTTKVLSSCRLVVNVIWNSVTAWSTGAAGTCGSLGRRTVNAAIRGRLSCPKCSEVRDARVSSDGIMTLVCDRGLHAVVARLWMILDVSRGSAEEGFKIRGSRSFEFVAEG